MAKFFYLVLLLFCINVYAEESAPVEFNTDFLLKSSHKSVDVSRFARGNPILAGTYRVDVYVNNNWIGHTDVTFKSAIPAENASPCFDRSLLELIGVDLSKLTPEATANLAAANNTSCLSLSKLVPAATVNYDSAEFRLNVGLPQMALRQNARGYVDPALWDQGVTAGSLGYNFNTFHVSGGAVPASTQSYLGLNGGINVAGWYLRNNGSLTQGTGQATHYQNVATYAQRNFSNIKSQLVLGDAFTSGNIFDSFGFRGVQLATDPRMLPDSQNGYAPVVRGIARTNAKVSIMQNGNLIYETTVAPGPFEISDLYATGYGGDLHVVVTEADGSKQSFAVPYASLVQLLRPGVTFYSVTAGQARDASIHKHPLVGQVTIQHGFNNVWTGYSGVIAAQDYWSLLAGVAFNTAIGAVALDLTHANTQLSHSIHANYSGQSVRLSYSKLLTDTDTNFSLAAYRYSSKGYYSFSEALQTQQALEQVNNGYNINNIDRKRNQLQLSVNQNLGGHYGSFFATGTSQNYWNRPGYNTQYQVGYNNNYKTLSYNISIQRQRDITENRTTTQVYLGISIPLGNETHSPTFTGNASYGDHSHMMQGLLSGTAGENDVFSYGVNGSYTDHTGQGGFNGQYRSPYAIVGASYSQTGRATQTSATISGAVVAHPGGVTLAQSLGDTIGVVEAKDAAGAAVTGSAPGVKIDHFGYAVVPYLTPYRANEVGLDPKGLSLDVELQSSSQQVVPYAGAVVMMKFKAVTGRSALITVTQLDGSSVPFGANVFDSAGKNVGIAGQGGRIFVRGLSADEGVLKVQWGETPDAQCSLTYHLAAPRKKSVANLEITEAVCR